MWRLGRLAFFDKDEKTVSDMAFSMLTEDELKRMSRQVKEHIPQHEVDQNEIM